jgi:cellulose 1,4-beta-cellobiosidase
MINQNVQTRSGLRRLFYIGASLSAFLTHSAVAGVACSIDKVNKWNTGYQLDVSVTNTGTTSVTSWSIDLKFSEPAQITNAWSATVTGSTTVNAKNVSYNGNLAPGQKTTFGFQGNHDGSFINPVCATGSSSVASSVKSSVASSVISSSSKSSVVSSSSKSSVVSSSSKSSLSSSSSSSSKVSSTSSSVGSVTRLDNPFVGAVWYVDPIWSANAMRDGGSKIANYNTAVWMDRIGAIAPTESGTMGLREHLDAAIAQNANLVQVVIYDLPNRDCFALSSNGELRISQNGFNRYKNEYIAPIAAIFADGKYKNLRIIAIIEPDSLPNLVTNSADPDCQEAAGAGGYIEATQYTLNTFYPLKNVYSYVDIAHSGWLGWAENFNKATTLIANAIKGTTAGVNSVAGFVSNTSNTTPLKEPFLDAFATTALPGSNGGTQVRQAKFYEWNPMFSEVGFVQAWRTKMISLGFPSSIGMLVDTSRNGWGGAARPKALSTSTAVDTFVDQSRIDRRSHRGMWCNQASGIGERPTVAPEVGIDAYVWVKPPGESDGVATAGIIDPTDPAKGFDRFCDPTFVAPGTNGLLTGAMPGAPHAGRWFKEGFKVLLNNAYPPL